MATITLNESEWSRIESLFERGLFAYAKFVIDGFTVSIMKTLVGRKLDIVCYVNGEVKGEWFTSETEIARRFYPFRLVPKFSKNTRDFNIKVWGKKEALQRNPDLHDKIRRPRLTYHTIKEVRQVFEANNDIISLLDTSY